MNPLKQITDAIESGNYQYLLQHPEFINYYNYYLPGRFQMDHIVIENPLPIQLATLRNNSNIVSYLLSCGANPNFSDPNSSAPPALHIAALLNNTQIIELLVTGGASLEIQNRQGLTLLHFALIHSSLKTFQFIYMLGADPNATNPNGETVYMAANGLNKNEKLRILNEGSNNQQLNLLKNRVLFLEHALNNVLNCLPDHIKAGCGTCSQCKMKEGHFICPVCNKTFCNEDWVCHVMIGCKNVH